MHKKFNVILDCDPGHDDAIAILLLGSKDYFNVLGVTTVSGNQTIEKTSRNAINVINYLGLPYKVYQGSDRPMVRERVNCAEIHGESGLDGFTFPDYQKHVEEKNAVSFLIDTIKSSKEKVVVVTTGPMTNLGKAIKIDPTIKDNIEKIVLMGGSIGAGNVTPAAEFNINCDPEAADICFNAGVPIYMIGLDVTRQVLVTKDVMDRMSKIKNKAGVLFNDLMIAFNKTQKEVFGLEGGPLHDPVTIASLIDENLVNFEYVNVTIDTHNGCSYGRTNCDIPDYLHLKKNAYVATSINVSLFWDIIKEALNSYK